MIRALIAAGVVVAGTAAQVPAPMPNAVVVFETAKGTIEVEVDAVHAPITAANFLRYVDGGFFDGGLINRVVRPDNPVRHDIEIQVIQFQIDETRENIHFVPLHRYGCSKGEFARDLPRLVPKIAQLVRDSDLVHSHVSYDLFRPIGAISCTRWPRGTRAATGPASTAARTTSR